jgi:hypothetical protein
MAWVWAEANGRAIAAARIATKVMEREEADGSDIILLSFHPAD